jgi:hypothetical protein
MLPAPNCAAAKGLAGDNLICVDFDKVTSLSDSALMNWNFNALMANCWQINSGMLQIPTFGSVAANCGLTLPQLDLSTLSSQHVTLSLVQRIDMSDQDSQWAQIYIDVDNPGRLLHETSGRSGLPTLISTQLTVKRSELPAALQNSFKFYLKASALNSVNGRQGWQIQSIAVNVSE